MKYIAYYRTSTRKQNLGIEAQKTAVKAFIASDNSNVLIAEYNEQESGKNDEREELNKAIEHCKKENAVLCIAKLDRLSRKISFIFSLKDSGVNFISLDIPNFNTLTLGIFATLAQTERELISERTKKSLSVKKAELERQGKKLGAPNARFTHEMRMLANMRKTSIAQNNTNNKRAICVIKVMLKQTKNATEIARYLNQNGFQTSRGCNFNCIQVKRLISRINNENITRVV